MKDLYEYVINFMIENKVSCKEDIVQSDKMQLLHEEFILDCYELVKSEIEEIGDYNEL
jgi:hypothetical protein